MPSIGINRYARCTARSLLRHCDIDVQRVVRHVRTAESGSIQQRVSDATTVIRVRSCRVTEAAGVDTDPTAAVRHLVDWSTAALDSGLLTRLRMDGSSYECDVASCAAFFC